MICPPAQTGRRGVIATADGPRLSTEDLLDRLVQTLRRFDVVSGGRRRIGDRLGQSTPSAEVIVANVLHLNRAVPVHRIGYRRALLIRGPDGAPDERPISMADMMSL